MSVINHASQMKLANKTVTFTGASGLGLAGTTTTLFTVTGRVLIIAMTAFCTTLLTESGATATVSVGIAGNTALIYPVTNSVNIDANEFWLDTDPTTGSDIAVPASAKDTAVASNIILSAATTNTTAGVITFDCWWMPLSPGATLT